MIKSRIYGLMINHVVFSNIILYLKDIRWFFWWYSRESVNIDEFTSIIIIDFFSNYNFHKQRAQHIADALSVNLQDTLIVYYDTSFNFSEKVYLEHKKENLIATNSLSRLCTILIWKRITVLSHIFHHYNLFHYLWLVFSYHYDYLDNLEPYHKKLYWYMLKNIKKFSKSVTCSSLLLQEQLKSIWVSSFYLPNGVNLLNREFKYQKQWKKIIGFYWWIAEHLDYDLITFLLQNLKEYDFHFLWWDDWWFIEKYKLDSYDNFHYLWQKKYSELWSYSSYFSLGIIPFQVNDVTNYVSPVKYFEYIAQWIPTISSCFYEMNQHKDFCLLANSKEEFLTYIRNNINLREDKDYTKRIMNYAKNFNWNNLTYNYIQSWKFESFYEQGQK